MSSDNMLNHWMIALGGFIHGSLGIIHIQILELALLEGLSLCRQAVDREVTVTQLWSQSLEPNYRMWSEIAVAPGLMAWKCLECGVGLTTP